MRLAEKQAEFPSIMPEDLRTLARGLGLEIPEENLAEVTYRFTALMDQLNRLHQVDLTVVDPRPIFPE